MVTIEQAFQSMVSGLELSEKERQEATRQQEVLRENLKQRLHRLNDFLTGSYRRHTAIRKLHDIDMFFVFDPVKHPEFAGPNSSPALRAVQDALRAAYPNCDPPRLQNRSVNIVFKGTGIGFDVVPAIPTGEVDVFKIPDSRTGGWILSNPKGHECLSTEANQAANKRLKPLVKAAKHWNRGHGKPLGSFHLEVMAAPPLRGFDGNYSEGLARLLRGLADGVLQPCPDPAGVGPDIDEGLSQGERQRAQAKLTAAADEADRALELAGDGRIEEAHYLWRKLLGDVYPEKGRSPSRAAAPVSASGGLGTRGGDDPGSRFG